MELAELLEREAIADGDQLLDWAHERVATLIAELDTEDSLRSLLDAGREIGPDPDLEGIPVTRRRRREPSSPQPKSADELPPPPQHPGLADGEPEPMLEMVDTGPIDLEDEIVRRRLREDSWALAAREVEAMVIEQDPRSSVAHPEVEQVIEAASEPSIEIEVDLLVMDGMDGMEVTSELPIQAPSAAELADVPIERPAEISTPELPVIVRPAESSDDPIAIPAPIDLAPAEFSLSTTDEQAEDDQAEDEDEFEVDDLDELEVDELVELDEEIDDDEEAAASAPKPPRPPPPKSAPPPIRNEVADMIAALAEPVRTGGTAVTRIDEVEGAPAPAAPAPEPASEDIDIDIE